MLDRQGFTLMEILVVLFIIVIAALVSFPNFTAPTEGAKSLTAQNNLLAIYSAEKNYFNNNNGSYCTGVSSTCGDTLADLNTNLSLNILDDGSYLYDCGKTTANACTAKRNNGPSAFSITVTLTAPIQLTNEVNPYCTPSNTNWCP